jgi:signal peptidase II
MSERKVPLAPFALTASILLLDQATKALVVARVERGTIAWSCLGDFFWLIHARNPGIAFSLGDGLAPALRSALFIALPLVLVAGIVVYYFKSKDLTVLQRWALCGIAGGGLGNLVDRIARPEGVVDFLSVKFYGLFGLERWPTFNVADSSVVVSAILLAISLFLAEKAAREAA